MQTILKHELGPIVVRESRDFGSLLIEVKEFQPDIVLLDWELRGRPAAALLLALNGPSIKPKVIVLSTKPEVEQSALAVGADAFVSKGDPPDRLLSVCHGLVEQLRAERGIGDGSASTT